MVPGPVVVLATNEGLDTRRILEDRLRKYRLALAPRQRGGGRFLTAGSPLWRRSLRGIGAPFPLPAASTKIAGCIMGVPGGLKPARAVIRLSLFDPRLGRAAPVFPFARGMNEFPRVSG